MTTHSTLTSKVVNRIAEVCEVEASALSCDMVMEEIGLDSLGLPRILDAFETELSVHFTQDEIAAFLQARSIGSFVDVLAAAVRQREGA